MTRLVAILLGLMLGANGLYMLFAAQAWYQAIPGVTETGPFNRHFVNDIGATFLVSAGGLFWAAWRPRQGWPALAAGTAFLALHALVHLVEVLGGHGMHAFLRDLKGVYAPALVALALMVLMRPKAEPAC